MLNVYAIWCAYGERFCYPSEFRTPREITGKCRWAGNNAFKSDPFSNAVAAYGLVPLWLNLRNSREISVGGDIGSLRFFFIQSALSSYLLTWCSHEKFG